MVVRCRPEIHGALRPADAAQTRRRVGQHNAVRESSKLRPRHNGTPDPFAEPSINALERQQDREVAAFAALKGPQKKAASQRFKNRAGRIAAVKKRRRRRALKNFFLHAPLLVSDFLHTRAAIRRGTFLLGALKEPQLCAQDEGRAHYGQLERWELCGKDGPRSDDVLQGGLGDCYLLAGIASMANRTQAIGRDMVRDQGKGLYSVRLYAPNAEGEWTPRWVGVDSRLPMNEGGRPIYAQARDTSGSAAPEIWPALVEKAFAKLNDEHHLVQDLPGYDGIGNGGLLVTPLRALTGKPVDQLMVAKASEADLKATLGRANRGDWVTAGTWTGGFGIAGRHAYSVLGITERDGVSMVRLRNPWGCCTPGNPRGGDGVFELSLQIFRLYFSHIAAANPRGA